MNTSINLSEFSSKSLTHINCSLSSLNEEMKFEDGQNQTEEEQPENYNVNNEIEIDQNYNHSENESVIFLAEAFVKFLEEKTGEINKAEAGKIQQDDLEDHNIVSSEEFKANAKALEENLPEKAQESLDLGNPLEGLPEDSFLDLQEFKKL